MPSKFNFSKLNWLKVIIKSRFNSIKDCSIQLLMKTDVKTCNFSLQIFLDLLSNFDRLSKIYESPFRIWFRPMLAIFVADAENVEIVLKSKDCFNKPNAFYKMMREGIGADGLITSRGTLFRYSSIWINIEVLFKYSIWKFYDKASIKDEGSFTAENHLFWLFLQLIFDTLLLDLPKMSERGANNLQSFAFFLLQTRMKRILFPFD